MEDSLRFEVLMNQKMLNDIHLDVNFINSISITNENLILLSSSDQFYLLGWGGIAPFGPKLSRSFDNYAFTPDNYLLIISDDFICSYDSSGSLSKIIKLPNENMELSAGKFVMYVYDNKNQQNSNLFLVAEGGKYAKLFEVTENISSVIEMNDSILFSSDNGLFTYSIMNKDINVLTALPKDEIIRSIAVDTSSNRIYFSTDDAVYALKGSSAVFVTDQFGGILRFFNDGLIVFNPKEKFLIRIAGIEEKVGFHQIKTVSHKEQAPLILTNISVVNLVKTKISDDQIINLINSSPVNFNTSVDSMIYLSGQNVSSQVILAMRNAMRMKSKPINSTDGTDTGNNIITNNQPVQNVTTSVAGSTPANRFYIITGSYPTEQQANEAVSDLKRKGFTGAEVVGKNSSGSFRIASKGYATNEEAIKDLTEIRQTVNSSAWIFEKK
jgi:hypothetical protein